jgi:hypothetical protein
MAEVACHNCYGSVHWLCGGQAAWRDFVQGEEDHVCIGCVIALPHACVIDIAYIRGVHKTKKNVYLVTGSLH